MVYFFFSTSPPRRLQKLCGTKHLHPQRVQLSHALIQAPGRRRRRRHAVVVVVVGVVAVVVVVVVVVEINEVTGLRPPGRAGAGAGAGASASGAGWGPFLDLKRTF
jgi:hypothetical protein